MSRDGGGVRLSAEWAAPSGPGSDAEGDEVDCGEAPPVPVNDQPLNVKGDRETLGAERLSVEVQAGDQCPQPEAGSPQGSPKPRWEFKGLSSAKTVSMAAVTAFLISTDQTIGRAITRLIPPEVADNGIGGRVTDLGSGQFTVGLVGALWALGDEEDEDTARLIAMGSASTAVVVTALKHLTGRERPTDSGGQTIFHGPSLRLDSFSFPSGHATNAFSMATILAERHPKRRWLYYTLAGAAALSRVARERHFFSDVFAGALVGHYIGKTILHNQDVILGWKIRF